MDINIKQLNDLNKDDLRIEAEFYQKKYVNLIQLLNNHKCVNLSELVSKPIQTGHTPSMNNSSFYGGTIKLIKTDNLRVNEICPPFAHYLTKLGNDEIKRTELQENDIITTIIGATYSVIGRSCIIHEDILPANINQNIAHIRPDRNKILPEYLNVYLNSKYGKLFLEYLSRQMEQVNLNCNEVGMVKVPIFTDVFQKKIETKVKSAYSKKTESQHLYASAENQLLEELGLKDWKPENQNVNVKTLKESFLSSGRLDAEYYQSKYDALFTQLSKYDCDTLNKIVNTKKSVEPGSDAYQDNGIPFIRVSDVDKFGISEPKIFLSSDDFDLQELRPKKDTILLSKDGSVGIAYKVEKDLDCITSGALLHLTVFNKDYNPDYLTLVLNSKIVKMQSERDANGAIIQHWKPSEIEQVIIPKLAKTIQDDISSKIQKSFALKAESKRLLEEAKLLVEREIEKGGK